MAHTKDFNTYLTDWLTEHHFKPELANNDTGRKLLEEYTKFLLTNIGLSGTLPSPEVVNGIVRSEEERFMSLYSNKQLANNIVFFRGTKNEVLNIKVDIAKEIKARFDKILLEEYGQLLAQKHNPNPPRIK